MSPATTPTLEVQLREKLGSRYTARIRKEGFVPAVVYGHKQGPVHVQVSSEELIPLLRQKAHLINIKVDDKSEHCVVKDMQWDYLGDNIIHIDFERVNLSEKVTMEVDVEFVGEPKALNEAGAFLDTVRNKLNLSCRADSIPERIEVNISELTTEKSITIADLDLPSGVEALSDPEKVVVQIKIAKEQPEEEAAEAGEGEPEVIGGAKEDEGAAE